MSGNGWSALLLAVCLALPSAAAIAQEQPAQPGSQSAPASQQSENWASSCTASARQATLDCSIEQRLIMQNTQQLVAAVTIRVPPETGAAVMMVQVPLGLYLPAGITLDVDGSSSESLEVQTCDASGCYGSSPVSEALLAAMTRGQNFNIKFQNLSRQPITVTANLVGFTAAFQRIR